MSSKKSYTQVLSQSTQSVLWLTKYQHEDEVSALNKVIELSVRDGSSVGDEESELELEVSADNKPLELNKDKICKNRVTTLLLNEVYSY